MSHLPKIVAKRPSKIDTITNKSNVRICMEVDMKLLKIRFDHVRMFKNGIFELDFYASDKVPSSDESVFSLGRPVYSNCIVALAGINASGKTTALNLIELACRVVNGTPLGASGLPSSLPTIFDGNPSMRALVWEDDRLFLIESSLVVAKPADGASASESAFELADETISRVPRISSKDPLSSWDVLRANSRELYRRTEILDSWIVLASPDVSICGAVLAKIVGRRCRIQVLRDDEARIREGSENLDAILRVFDPRIEHLEVNDSGRAFEIGFSDGKLLSLSEAGLREVLSSGTVRGLSLVQRAMKTLESGGVLLVDELENHLNRQLVNVVVDLFASRETNPQGAVLVFTTHYPQLLDHIHRKDDVYFLAHGEAGLTRIVKYGDKVERIENKKSEVFASNYIKGTAPRYVDVRTLRHLVSESVATHE